MCDCRLENYKLATDKRFWSEIVVGSTVGCRLLTFYFHGNSSLDNTAGLHN
jgi:hypothetical protein